MIEPLLEMVRSCRGVLRLATLLDRVGLDDFKVLMHEVARNDSIFDVSLACNKLSSDAMCVVAEFLANSRNLARISLTGNKIEPDAAKAIAEAIMMNRSIRALHMGHCNLGPTSIQLLLDAIKTNRHIEFLSMSGNNIGSEGALVVCDLIRTASIRGLWLSTHDFGPDGIKAVMDAMAENQTIRKFMVTFQDDASASALVPMLDKNTTIRYLKSNVKSDHLQAQLKLRMFVNRHLHRVRLNKYKHAFDLYSGMHEAGISRIIRVYMK